MENESISTVGVIIAMYHSFGLKMPEFQGEWTCQNYMWHLGRNALRRMLSVGM